MNKAKIFKNGQSQAVRLPKKFRFKTKEVSVIQLGESIILQPCPKTWQEVFKKITPTNGFLNNREALPPQEREYFK